jgi:hypothetical protein
VTRVRRAVVVLVAWLDPLVVVALVACLDPLVVEVGCLVSFKLICTVIE